MATAGQPGSGAAFDSVIAKDKSHKGVNKGEFKFMLEGLQNSDPAQAAFENGKIRAWCQMKDRRYSFSFELPKDAKIDASSISVPANERKKGKFKVFFNKSSDFQLRNIFH